MLNSTSSERIYFPNLNSFRFFAALAVFVHHFQQLKYLHGLPNSWNNPMILIVGKLGVIFFFVLSGFLITYILISERNGKSNIDLKSFYLKRALRIWPLYFLFVFLSLFIIPHFPSLELPGYPVEIVQNNLILKLFSFVFFIPNFASFFLGLTPYAGQLWSIGAEEQFYCFWPLLLKYFKSVKNILFSTLSTLLVIETYLRLTNSQILLNMWNMAPMSCMIIGGGFAYLHLSKDNIAKRIKEIAFFKKFQLANLLALFILFSSGFSHENFLHKETYSIIFGFIIINFATNQKRIFDFEYRLLSYLGKISYGIYMYHPLVIGMTLIGAENLNAEVNALSMIVALIITIMLSAVSYKYFETVFLKMNKS